MEIKVLIIATLFSLIAGLYHVADRRLARSSEPWTAKKA
jgi:hypothetical protein